jgi:hypothetical protein
MKTISVQIASACLVVTLSWALMLALTGPASAADSAGTGAISGTIAETMDAADYTYVQIDSGTEKTWVAIPRTDVAAGDQISVLPGMEMKDFHSNSLDRTFDSIIFSPGVVGAKPASPHGRSKPQSPTGTAGDQQPSPSNSFAAAVAAEQGSATAAPVQPQQGSAGSMGAVAPFAETSVEKATGENSYTVEEIFAQAKELDGKSVRVKGQVVKFNANIMGKNWLHIQDGTGDPMKNSHDLVVTTTDQLSGPKIITVEGTIAADKDFGAGYKYQVLIENATITE